MYEQDIELARLLVEKLTMMQQRADKIREELSSAESELDRLKDVRSEREAYLEVLSRAAKLLDRSDLQLDSPESKEAEDSVARLRQQLSEVDSEVAEYGVIFEELRERAPKLIAALEQGSAEPAADAPDAGGEAESAGDEAVEEGAGEGGAEDSLQESLEESGERVEALQKNEEDWFGEKEGEPAPLSEGEVATVLAESAAEAAAIAELEGDSVSVSTDEGGLEIAQEVAVGSLSSASQSQNGSYANASAEAPAAEAVAVEEEAPAAAAAPAVLDRKQILQRFNLRNIRAKEAFTYGRNAIYILDTPSIISRIPNYDISLRKIQPMEVYQELLRDVDTLSREVSGSFYLIFDREFTSPLELSEEVFPVGVAGEGERTLEATRTEVRNVVNEQSGRQRSVCLVTADKSLAESVSGPGVHFVQLSDFFQT